MTAQTVSGKSVKEEYDADDGSNDAYSRELSEVVFNEVIKFILAGINKF